MPLFPAPPLPTPLTLAPRSVAEVRGETCKEFYSLAAHGNLELLPRGSAQRRAILHGALACVVSGAVPRDLCWGW